MILYSNLNDCKLFIFGFGYSAEFLASKLPANCLVAGTTTSKEKLNKYSNVALQLFSPADNKTEIDLPADTTHLLISIPPEPSGDLVLQYKKEQITRLKELKWIGLLSSTSVYGDHQGNWADEKSTTIPTTENGKKRLAAEQEWQRFAANHQLPLHIFRLAGIYGPGRNIIEQVKSAKIKLINKPGHKFSRIHVEDIAGVLINSMNHPTPSEIFNIADDYPAATIEVAEFIAEKLSAKLPPIGNISDLSPGSMLAEFYQDSKLVANNKIKRKLNYKLLFPDYKIGLKPLLQ